MVVEILNTGTELLLGKVLNTHQQWLCRRLADLGCPVSRQVAVPDTGKEIELAVREALGRADWIITTGGLGPTSDDLTRDLVAGLAGRKLVEHAETREQIRAYFAGRKLPMPERVLVQAFVPEGAVIFANARGTAPGLAMEFNPNPFRAGGSGCWLVMLPGPTRELRPMFEEQVVPWMKRTLPSEGPFAQRTLRTAGIGESAVEELVAGPLAAAVAGGIELGYCARPGQVDVRVAARGENAERMVEDAENIVRLHLGRRIFGVEDEDLETVVVRMLTEQKKTLALAESCTGGWVANRITNVAGASAVFLGGVVSYSNKAKQAMLGVSAQSLELHGAVSEPVAREMAEGARRRFGADYALGVTGIAGPSGGTPEKPAGTVFIAAASPRGTEAWKMFNPLDRLSFKELTSLQALNLLRRMLE
jgi:nicotinamide-nucleotide amidase